MASCYAPTRAANREDKTKFYNTLGSVVGWGLPNGEMYILLGDFNARVGSREHCNDQWSNVRGPHGYGEVNDAGKELLSFLAMNEAVICNTWFMKKNIHKTTWQHPKSKQCHETKRQV